MSAPTRTTLLAALAVLLTASALSAVYEGAGWLPEVVGAVLAVTAAGLAGRRLRLPWVVQPVVAAVAVLWYSSALFARSTLALGLVPTGASVEALGTRLGEGLLGVEELTAPVPTEPGLVLLAVLGVAGVAALVDLLAVALHRPALAGLPLLTLLAVPSGTVAGGVGWWPFALGATGWLLLLMADAGDRVDRWGTALRPARARGATVSDESSLGRVGRRIGVAAVGAAVVVPALVPGLEARVFESGSGFGPGSSSAVVYNPLTELAGQLRLPEPRPVLDYATSDPAPDYLRLTTLDLFDPDAGWSSSELTADVRRDQVSDGIPTPEPLEDAEVRPLTTRVEVRELGGPWLPVPAYPTRVDVDGPWLWDAESETVFSTRTAVSDVEEPYQVTARRVLPDPEALRRGGTLPPEVEALAQPPAVSEFVAQLTDQVTADARTDYDEVVALQAYFRDPSNGFRYSEDVPTIAAPDALEAFLRGKAGFCEQYASAMAAMVRLRGIPARVAVGFTPGTAAGGGTYRVTTDDAHAWPEVWFPEAGWVRFEPTPRAAQVTTPGYTAPAPAGEDDPSAPAPAPGETAAPTPGASTPADAAGRDPRFDEEGGLTGAGSADDGAAGWLRPVGLALLAALAVLAVPVLLAALRRRSRWRSPGAEAAWAQVAEDAQDVGHRWRATDTPRAAAARLVAERGLRADAADAVGRLATAVERARYARDGGAAGAERLRADAATVRAGLHATAGRRARWAARLLPVSTLQWATSAAGARTADGLDRLDDAVAWVGRRLRPARTG